MPFTQRTDWQDLPAGGTPVLAADLLRIEQGVKDGVDHSDAAHATANADNTAANETSHVAEAAHRTGDGSDHADVAANTAAIAALDREAITTIASGATCVIDYSTGAMIYKHTVTQNVTISIINLPLTAPWWLVLILTNGGAFTVSYDAAWQEDSGTALTFTAAGKDRLLLSGEGQVAASVVAGISRLDVK